MDKEIIFLPITDSTNEEAKRLAEESGLTDITLNYIYFTARPNMKETAILMIADSVESAARTLKDHSQEELDSMINNIIQTKLIFLHLQLCYMKHLLKITLKQ